MNQTESQPPTVPKPKGTTSNVGCLVVLVVVVVVFFALLIPLMPGSRPVRHLQMKCVSNLKQICMGAIIWAHDRETNQLPSDFLCMSNELGSLDIMVCPADRKRTPARDWGHFTSNNCSYEMVGPGSRVDRTNVFVRCLIHGHQGYADASVVTGATAKSR